jgi:murein DD-endopeptidase MepM/ murein hydrolase activator NlpD
VRHLYRKGYHTGLDIGGVNEGALVIAPRDGVVSVAGVNGGYGNCVVIDVEDGLQALFGHLFSIAVAVGDQVQRGQVLGGVGTTGVSTGVHLHYEWRRDGEDVSPVPFVTLDPPGGRTAIVKEDLNLRSGPSKNDPIIMTVPAGTVVNVGLDGWLPVWFEGRKGWMFAEFLRIR